MDSTLQITAMTPEKLKTIMVWANKESWSESEHDIEAFLAIDPTGCFVGEVNGEPVSSVTGVKYNNYSHVGLYIAREDCRKKGYGLPMFKHAMEYLKDMPSIGLDAVEAQKHNYEKWGFKVYDKTPRFGKKAEGTLSSDLKDMREVSMDLIDQYDTLILGGNSRKEFLKALIAQKPNHGLCRIDEEGKVRGFGIIRKCDGVYKIGPLLADDKETAAKIILGLQSKIVGENVLIDVFESNQDALEILKEQNWERYVDFYRMYAKSAPQFDTKKLYVPVIEVI